MPPVPPCEKFPMQLSAHMVLPLPVVEAKEAIAQQTCPPVHSLGSWQAMLTEMSRSVGRAMSVADAKSWPVWVTAKSAGTLPSRLWFCDSMGALEQPKRARDPRTTADSILLCMRRFGA